MTVGANGLSCSAAYGIFPDQGLNMFLLHWQADSLPPSHQESPIANISYFCLVLSNSEDALSYIISFDPHKHLVCSQRIKFYFQFIGKDQKY